jgi:hypothetical protein
MVACTTNVSETKNIAPPVREAGKVVKTEEPNFFIREVKAIGKVRPIPERAHQYLPIVKHTALEYMPGFEYPYYFGGLIEHESCVSLTSKRCWSPTAELRSKRELGIGLSQITKTFDANGKIRFDVLAGMKKQYSRELKELSWSNIASRPDLQIRAMVLMTKDNFNALSKVPDVYERLAMTDAAYNGGLGGVRKERTACGLAKGCDPNKWFDNVEDHCLKSKKALYAGRSACVINRHHVDDILTDRMLKYKPYM